jgi:hypothetical protein
MDRGTWKQPVILEISGQTRPVIVAGNVDAATMLLKAWPTRRNEAYVAAVMSCRDVLKGQSSAALARADFIEAALAAGFRVQPRTFLGGAAEPVEDVSAPTAALPNAPDHLAPLEPFQRPPSRTSRLSQPLPPLPDTADTETASRRHRPVINWSEPVGGTSRPFPLSSKAARLREWFGPFAGTLKMIARLCARTTAGSFQLLVRRRRSGSAAGADASLGRS